MCEIVMYPTTYRLGDFVYLKTDKDQTRRMVVGIHIRPSGTTYSLAKGETETTHYEIEISSEVDVSQTL